MCLMRSMLMSIPNIEKSRSVRLELRLPRQGRSDWPRDALVLPQSTLPQSSLERENKSPLALLISSFDKP